jgi:flavin reductase (DIM6/NTAB) family NADH-FMN oxidoreductase RutF
MYYSCEQGPIAAGLRHNPLNALVAPRPIGWISTIDREGRDNLAPFSYFNLFSLDPPVLVFAPNQKDPSGTPKDSLRNVREVPEFVAHIVPWRLRTQMNETSRVLPHGESEFDRAGLESLPSTLVRPRRIATAPAAMECRVLDIVALPEVRAGRRSHLVIGEIVAVHIANEVIVDGVVDVLALSPTARLGGFDYTHVESIESMRRPSEGLAKEV